MYAQSGSRAEVQARCSPERQRRGADGPALSANGGARHDGGRDTEAAGPQAAAFVRRGSGNPVKNKFTVGDPVEYLSSTNGGRWVPCAIHALHLDGSIQLDCKVGYWMSPKDQDAKLRAKSGPQHAAPRASSRYDLGQHLQYHSLTNGCWVIARVVCIDSSGALQLDCKQGQWLDAEQQAARMCPLAESEPTAQDKSPEGATGWATDGGITAEPGRLPQPLRRSDSIGAHGAAVVERRGASEAMGRRVSLESAARATGYPSTADTNDGNPPLRRASTGTPNAGLVTSVKDAGSRRQPDDRQLQRQRTSRLQADLLPAQTQLPAKHAGGYEHNTGLPPGPTRSPQDATRPVAGGLDPGSSGSGDNWGPAMSASATIRPREVQIVAPGGGARANGKVYATLGQEAEFRVGIVGRSGAAYDRYPPGWPGGCEAPNLESFAQGLLGKLQSSPPECLVLGSRGGQVVLPTLWAAIGEQVPPAVVINGGCAMALPTPIVWPDAAVSFLLLGGQDELFKARMGQEEYLADARNRVPLSNRTTAILLVREMRHMPQSGLLGAILQDLIMAAVKWKERPSVAPQAEFDSILATLQRNGWSGRLLHKSASAGWLDRAVAPSKGGSGDRKQSGGLTFVQPNAPPEQPRKAGPGTATAERRSCSGPPASGVLPRPLGSKIKLDDADLSYD